MSYIPEYKFTYFTIPGVSSYHFGAVSNEKAKGTKKFSYCYQVAMNESMQSLYEDKDIILEHSTLSFSEDHLWDFIDALSESAPKPRYDLCFVDKESRLQLFYNQKFSLGDCYFMASSPLCEEVIFRPDFYNFNLTIPESKKSEWVNFLKMQYFEKNSISYKVNYIKNNKNFLSRLFFFDQGLKKEIYSPIENSLKGRNKEKSIGYFHISFSLCYEILLALEKIKEDSIVTTSSFDLSFNSESGKYFLSLHHSPKIQMRASRLQLVTFFSLLLSNFKRAEKNYNYYDELYSF